MTQDVHDSLGLLFRELIDGPPEGESFMLNGGDVGLLRSLESVSAAAASATPPAGGASIAAHVDHIRYGLELLNRWSGGDPNPWATADWTASWKRTTVTDEGWTALRQHLRDEARRWLEALGQPREMVAVERNGVIGSIAHLAYHLGAIRQIDKATQGPKAE
jgi:hypothetical protein